MSTPETPTETVIFFREEGFYPLAVRPSENLAEHARLNPGTIRIEDMHGRVLWPAATPTHPHGCPLPETPTCERCSQPSMHHRVRDNACPIPEGGFSESEQYAETPPAVQDGGDMRETPDNQETMKEQKEVTPDYDMNIHNNPDARAWAVFFNATIRKLASEKSPTTAAERHTAIARLVEDTDYMHVWFANAMMAMHDYLRARSLERKEKSSE